MKKFLLTSVIASAALGMIAAQPADNLHVVKASDNLNETRIKNAPAKNAVRLADGVTVSSSNGIKKLDIADYLFGKQQSIKPLHSQIGRVKAPAESVLFESFEGWDGEDINWTPEGWTVDMRGEVERKQSWTPYTPNPMYGLVAVPDGKYGYAVSFGSASQDEWLISPEVEIAEGYALSYWLYLDPAYIFSLDNVDWDTLEFTEEPEVAATLQIWAQPEGGEWTMLHDYADDFRGLSFLELSYLTPAAMEKKNISLDEFAGKKAKIAFRYVGIDGNTMMIDAINVGYPQLEDISYMDPFSILYWGFGKSWYLPSAGADVAMIPVYEPVTWTNMSYHDGAVYEWSYIDPVTFKETTDNNPDELTVTYLPNYSSEATLINNFIAPPVLNASAPMSAPASYSAPYLCLQAGGKPTITFNDATTLEPTLFPFAPHFTDITYITCDDEEIGDNAIPVFGYNNHTDQYWLNYSLNGSEAAETDYNRLEGIANLFMPTEAPLVVSGISAYGWGKVAPDAEFKATIYALDSDMSNDYESFEVIASTTLKGADFIVEYNDAKGYMYMPFKFSEPVVIKQTEEHPAYFIMLEGFNSDKVEYFAPLQSSFPDPNYMCLGYILSHVDLSAHIQRGEYYNIKPMVYKKDGEYVDLYSSFAIGLDAEYPWLTTETTEIELTANGTPVEVALGSYYDGSDLTVEVPAGVEATVTERYDKCVLTVSHNAATVIADGDIVVKGPGVEVTIAVKENIAGISDISAVNEAEVAGMYDLNGLRVNPADAEEGIYVVKYADGSATKKVIRK